ncbi:GCN5 family acetyltransferase [Rhodopseudomonas palustris]|uniref:GCN5 family acetyltransferase n=2 Tax=Nitrobacteraceae TaxID=41294 RepID=A0A0D7F5D7_RHOPL|nr:GCN5 family acetyltransferase [Rhodopseudomonas palustris]
MQAVDLAAVQAIADRVHRDYPEDQSVFAERLALCPGGCHVLESADQRYGYVVSHPWRYADPPKLNQLIAPLPTQPSTYYIHDIAFLPQAQGRQAASRIVRELLMLATQAGLQNASLIAINGSQPFWAHLGFRVAAQDALRDKLASYGADARFMVRDLPA